MKYILLFLLFFTLSSCAQDNHLKEKQEYIFNIPLVDSAMFNILDHYFVHLEENKIDIHRFDRLKMIKFVPDSTMTNMIGVKSWGATSRFKGGPMFIYLNDELLEMDRKFLEMIFYHEMWHVYMDDGKHCDEEGCFWLFNTKVSTLHVIGWNTSSIKRYFFELKEL